MLIEKVIRKLKGNPNYKWESEYGLRELSTILRSRCNQVLRGTWRKLFFRESHGLVFMGAGVIIKHPYLFTAGSNLILEDHVYINALSSNGILVKNNVSLARNCTMICTGVIAHKGVGITIGNNSGINAGTYLAGQGGIEIGDHVIIGPGVKIFSENHNFSDPGLNIKDQGVTRSSVIIGDNCWIGAGATILAGVTIGAGSVIAAGCVVTKSVEANSVVVGIPGKVLKSRKESFEHGVIKNINRAG